MFISMHFNYIIIIVIRGHTTKQTNYNNKLAEYI